MTIYIEQTSPINTTNKTMLH